MSDATEIINRYWSACQARDWKKFSALLAPDLVYELPQTRERIIGRKAYVEFNATFPGDWEVEIVRMLGNHKHAASWNSFEVNGNEHVGVCFFELDENNRISHITDFWPEPYEPPAGREHLTERY
jgi:hypothetical protein